MAKAWLPSFGHGGRARQPGEPLAAPGAQPRLYPLLSHHTAGNAHVSGPCWGCVKVGVRNTHFKALLSTRDQRAFTEPASTAETHMAAPGPLISGEGESHKETSGGWGPCLAALPVSPDEQRHLRPHRVPVWKGPPRPLPEPIPGSASECPWEPRPAGFSPVWQVLREPVLQTLPGPSRLEALGGGGGGRGGRPGR